MALMAGLLGSRRVIVKGSRHAQGLQEIAQPIGLCCRIGNKVLEHVTFPVGAGAPANGPARCMAPAPPVFAGMPAPTGTVQDSVMARQQPDLRYHGASCFQVELRTGG
ncbi:hypothetical protein C163_09015 [Pseudomonas sp. FGI182]|nr:hypothetical protein C163_09015 [Pseudomonas sp. FGI182]